MPTDNQTVLLIEEEPTLREITAFRLELLGYEVVALGSAEEAATWLQDDLPRMVIVGHFLPGMDGADLIDRLSNDVRTSELPVMYLSPNSDLEDVQRAFNAGADEYLVTPYDPIVLEKKVTRLAEAAGLPATAG
ncbi:MAG: response regulator [Planctomycetota bacterium]